MVDFINNKATKRLEHEVVRYFQGHGWSTSETKRSEQGVIQVWRGSLMLFIRCLDANVQLFLGLAQLIDRMENFTREYRGRSGELIVFVVNQPFAGLNPSKLLERNVVLLSVSDLAALSDLDRIHYGRIFCLNSQEQVILRGCKSLCVSLSETAVRDADFSAGRRWLEVTIEGVHCVLEAHYRLVDLLASDGDYDVAKDVAEEALKISPRNLRMLKKLRNIEVLTGNLGALRTIDERIEISQEIRPSLEAILAKQRAATVSYKASNSEPLNTTLNGSLIQKLLRQLCSKWL